MKIIVLLMAAVLFPGILMFGQDNLWLAVPDISTGVSVEMPGLPKFERKTVYHDDQYLIKEIFSFKNEDIEMVFESQPLLDNSKKAVSKAINKAVDFLALYQKGKPGKKESLSRNGINYQYVETELSTGKLIRSILFALRGKLFHLYVNGSPENVFKVDANHYLESWTPGSEAAAIGNDEPKENTSIGTEQDDASMPNTWETISINNTIEASFPRTPFKKTTLVEFGTRDFVVEAYSRYSRTSGMNYVLTCKSYGPEEGQLDNADLYEFIVSQIVAIKKVKLNAVADVSGNGFEAREYLLSKGIRFYKLHLFRIDNTIYQCLVKGKRKTIDRPESIRFFNSIKTLDHHGH